ncbi:hypothetical protein [Paludisphaera borealis]|uniref:Fibronectin type-III domain-containing protein n=1 Tax=Paludisphaera borealis TaxID=1387353 RepID=A0A1U7CN58_9BACT|nr:hypothetical protein [Paludisphaera borealis]APW60323.1 hypothetical protein BSF38_01791 [Paludisphaera borealis]
MIDNGFKRRPRGISILALFGSIAGVIAALGPFSVFGKLETWRQEGASAFAKHHRERVVISEQGKVRLSQALVPTGSLAADRVWDLARGNDGALYAATGDSGKVFRRAAQEPSSWELALDAADSQALSLVVLSDGKVFVGTGPTGQVVDVSDAKHPASRPDPNVQYIWDLAADAQGNLFAATGPNGQLWKRNAQGQWSLLYDSKATHLLSVAVAPDGAVYAGSDGEGLIYRIGQDAKVSVVYDAPQSEVRTLLIGPDGSLYAGTAAEAGGGSNRPAGLFSQRDSGSRSDDSADHAVAVASGPRAANDAIELAQAKKPDAAPQAKGAGRASGGSASPKPATPGENAVYRIDREGVAREVFRAKALIFALARLGDRLLVGTGPDGLLYEVREDDNESTPVAKLDTGQILSLLAEPNGGLLIGTGDPGSVVRLSPSFADHGELVSDVFDAKLPSRFGALSWRGDTPEGSSIAVQVRSGNVGEPDETWSDWSAEQKNPEQASAQTRSGRFVQYRAKLSTTDPRHTPELRGVSLSYRSTNLPPEINKLETPDVSTSDGTARQTKLTIRWDVSDPNDDELNYTVQVRKEGWPAWIDLTESPITEKSYAWDTTAFPSGRYQVRLVAGDRPSNSPDEALVREKESATFLVDHDPPQVSITPGDRKATATLTDAFTRLVKAEYAVDGGAWTSVFPDDGLFDTLREQLTIALPDLKPGAHLLMVRATDAAGNVGSGDALITVKD